MSKLKTPREKKAASYVHDRRNSYGENAKASRKNIPRSKARVRRAQRRIVAQAFHDPSDAATGTTWEKLETTIYESKLQRLRGFRKVPDLPLREVIARKRRRRRVAAE